MKAMFTGFVGIAVIAIAAHFALAEAGFSSQEVYSSPNARVD